ncbi:4-alpha-glucanotransferase [Oceanivirga salmonicida]|uniref:4-alpha-glucanotransferase n=1 Tax=Oceanivirga salmonicida TaxID=1769291 RepID=UPI0008348283|nr:4-alpha-glucanotransferase [Oceanivirga salmonicida]
MDKRRSGILMHITSLPGKFGIGTFGEEAYKFIDFLVETKQTYWQILPLTTTSYGDSPYQSFSAMAGNTNLIDFDLLVQKNFLEVSDYSNVNFGDNDDKVDYALLFKARRPILEKAVANFLTLDIKEDFYNFEKENEFWLEDYAQFMAIKEHFGNKAITKWDDPKAIIRDENTLEYYKEELNFEIMFHKVCQYFFFKQWLDLKNYANSKNIKIIGDIPIYISADSVEVWTMPELFMVNEKREAIYVSGCPSDSFSEDGQLWGNPTYNWKEHKRTKFKWWIDRIRQNFKMYDLLRIDHFKGFSDYWEIDGNSKIANSGKWQVGVGIDLFDAIKNELGDLDIIAEDLGYVDERSKKLLADTGFPGMKILEFGFYDTTGNSIDSPHSCVPNSVVYSGTHDNEVINGWYENLNPSQKEYFNTYINKKDDELVSRAMLRTLFSTVSNIAIASMQDILDKDASSRMNIPSTVGGNWQWRMKKDDLTDDKKEFLIKITKIYNRVNIL